MERPRHGNAEAAPDGGEWIGRGRSQGTTETLWLESPEAPEAIRYICAAPWPIQESDHPHPVVCDRVILLLARPRRCVHYCYHRPRQRPPRVLAGARCEERCGEVARHCADQGFRASRWKSPRRPRRGDCARRYRCFERRRCRPGRLPDPGVQGSLRR